MTYTPVIVCQRSADTKRVRLNNPTSFPLPPLVVSGVNIPPVFYSFHARSINRSFFCAS